MSNITQLKTVVKAYLQTQHPATEINSLFSQGDAGAAETLIDSLILQAANNARRAGEMKHDFQLADVTVAGVIPTDGTGLDLNALTIDGSTGQLKTLHSVSLRTNNVDRPLRFESKQRMVHRLIERQDKSDWETGAWENELSYCGTTDQRVLVHGWRLFLYPESSADTTVYVDGNRWLPDYSVAAVGVQQTETGTVSGTVSSSGDMRVNVFGTGLTGVNYVTVGVLQNDTAAQVATKLANAFNASHPYRTTYTLDVYDTNKLRLTCLQPAANDAALSFTVTNHTAAGITPFGSVNGVVGVADTQQATQNQTDFFLQYGFEYMQWATIVEVNHLVQTFVPRQEGSLAPPEKLRDLAFANFMTWDSYMRESGRNIVLD